MKESITLTAPAKVNLHLQIFPKREDGFHNLRSLFVMISLFDELKIVPSDHGGCEVFGFSGIPLQENLIWKAYSLYVKEIGYDIGVDVHCTKNIPPMSGLGGGSSDAAALLKGLQVLGKSRGRPILGISQLREIAARLGSDVPFFLGQSAALAGGRGDLLEPVSIQREYDLVVIRPEFNISTAEAYHRFDLFAKNPGNVHRPELPAEHVVREFIDFSPEKWDFFNSFTSIMGDHHPQIESLISELYLKGAAYANLSGSGSAVYGVFTGEKTAEEGAKSFKKRLKNVWKLKMLASVPEAVYNKFD